MSHRLLLLGLWLTLMMLAMKVWIGWATRSLSVAAEALQTLITSFSLLLSVLALSSPHPAKRELWGHTRWESTLALLLIGFLGAAYCFLLSIAAEHIGFLGGSATTVYLNTTVLQVLGAIALLNLGLSFIGRYHAQVMDHAGLRFTFGQTLQDAVLMASVVLGLVGVAHGMIWLDPAIAGLILLVALVNVWRVINGQLPAMMRQVAIAPEAIARIARRAEGVLHCYDIHSRGIVGRLVWIKLRLIVHPECVGVAPEIVQRVERLLHQHYGPAKVTIQVDQDLPGTPNHREG